MTTRLLTIALALSTCALVACGDGKKTNDAGIVDAGDAGHAADVPDGGDAGYAEGTPIPPAHPDAPAAVTDAGQKSDKKKK